MLVWRRIPCLNGEKLELFIGVRIIWFANYFVLNLKNSNLLNLNKYYLLYAYFILTYKCIHICEHLKHFVFGYNIFYNIFIKQKRQKTVFTSYICTLTPWPCCVLFLLAKLIVNICYSLCFTERREGRKTRSSSTTSYAPKTWSLLCGKYFGCIVSYIKYQLHNFSITFLSEFSWAFQNISSGKPELEQVYRVDAVQASRVGETKSETWWQLYWSHEDLQRPNDSNCHSAIEKGLNPVSTKH